MGPIADFVRREKPDILCLQEVISLPRGDDVIFLSLDKLGQAFGSDCHTYYSPVFSFGFLRRRAEFGNAILSKLPYLEKQTHFTNGDYAENRDYIEDDINMRNLQHVKIELSGGKTLNVLNHHGYHIEHHKNGDEQTLRQCQFIADYIRTLDGPVILCGDFNLGTTSESIKEIDKVLTNLSSKNSLTTTRTPLSKKTEVCDYIFVNDQIQVKNFATSSAVVSDHQALVLEFDV